MKNLLRLIPMMVLLLVAYSCQPGYQPNDLVNAIKERNQAHALTIINSGIDVNQADSNGVTPMHLAAQYALPQVVRQLIDADADLNVKDQVGYTPLNYAIVSGNQQLIHLLLWGGAATYHSGLPDMQDGPYVDYTAGGYYAYYLVHDSILGVTYQSGKQLPVGTTHFQGWEKDTMHYTLASFNAPKWDVSTDQPLFVLGDVHGQYDRLIRNLQSNNIIDAQLNWAFGKGHLVFVGDFMDRGDKVTEAFWLIYRLEQQAQKAGGDVHMVYGNHEMMVLNNDLRYINDKYEALTENTGINYKDLFHPNSVLGEWLHNRPAMIKINDMLFVHGGVSSKLLEQFQSIEGINTAVNHYFKGGANPQNAADLDLITTSFGPFWYRGYFMKRSKYDKITEEELDQVMAQLDVSAIVVGHTENDEISGYFDGKVIDVNIPLWNKEVPNQGLWIEDGHFYRVTEGGDKVQLR